LLCILSFLLACFLWRPLVCALIEW
jgi:hypothetical protein